MHAVGELGLQQRARHRQDGCVWRVCTRLNTCDGANESTESRPLRANPPVRVLAQHRRFSSTDCRRRRRRRSPVPIRSYLLTVHTNEHIVLTCARMLGPAQRMRPTGLFACACTSMKWRVVDSVLSITCSCTCWWSLETHQQTTQCRRRQSAFTCVVCEEDISQVGAVSLSLFLRITTYRQFTVFHFCCHLYLLVSARANARSLDCTPLPHRRAQRTPGQIVSTYPQVQPPSTAGILKNRS